MTYRPLVPLRPLTVREFYSVHYFEYSGSYAFTGERHDFWELLYVDRGSLQVTAGERDLRLSQGQLIFHPPGEFHALSAVGVAPDLVVVSFRCDGEAMEQFRGLVAFVGQEERALLGRMVAESGAAFSTPLGDPRTTRLERREDQPFGGEQLLCAALEELLIRLARRRSAPEPQGSAPPEGSPLFAQVTEYLERRLDQSLTLEQICQDNLVGRSQLQKLFHSCTGGGVMEYFHGRKLQAARRMIREGRRNFTQIAACLGFQSVHYFSRRFKAATGMSPSEYARSVRMLAELPGPPPKEGEGDSGGKPDDCANKWQDRLFQFSPGEDTIKSETTPGNLGGCKRDQEGEDL